MIEIGGALPSAPHGDFFALAEQRFSWLDQRQQVLAQNIANANTPRYEPRDLVPFSQYLASAPAANASAAPSRTDPAHLAGTLPPIATVVPPPRERAPDGNAVEIEGELTKVADTETQQALVGNLWKSTMGLYLAALGRSG